MADWSNCTTCGAMIDWRERGECDSCRSEHYHKEKKEQKFTERYEEEREYQQWKKKNRPEESYSEKR